MDKPLLLIAGIAIVGAVVRSLKADALGALLERYGLPQVPKRALPWVSVLLGILYAVLLQLDARGTAAWQEAVTYGLIEGLGIGVGAAGAHDLGRGVPGVTRALGVVVFVSIATTSCAAWQRQAARAVLDVATIGCILAHQDLPDGDVAKVCDVAKPFFGPMRDVLVQSRLETAKAAASAEARATLARCTDDTGR